MKVASTVRVPQTKISTNTDKDDFSPAVFTEVKIKTKSSCYRIFSLLRLCFVFYGEIYPENE